MNLVALKERLDERSDALWVVRNGPYGYLRAGRHFEPTIAKLDRIRSKIQERLESAEKRALTIQRSEKLTRTLANGLRNFQAGKRFMSLDIEQTREGVLQEVGVTLFRLKSIETFNYRVVGQERNIPCLFGNTLNMRVEQIYQTLRIHAESADYYVGHSLFNDLKWFEDNCLPLPDRYYYDTAQLSKLMFGYTFKLVDLAHQFNVGGSKFHNAGNDSRYTADVFLKMVHGNVKEAS